MYEDLRRRAREGPGTDTSLDLQLVVREGVAGWMELLGTLPDVPSGPSLLLIDPTVRPSLPASVRSEMIHVLTDLTCRHLREVLP